MIAVLGSAGYRPPGDGRPEGVTGLAGAIAVAAPARGGAVQLVARIGDDREGDALLLALARAGVGHAAVLRDAGIRTRTVGLPETAVDVDESALDLLDEAGSPGTASKAPAGEPPAAPEAALARLGAGDVELALRYLSDIAVIVVTEPLDAGASSAVAAGAAFAGAQLVAVVEPGQAVPEAFEGGSVFEMPGGDAGPAFASFVAAYAAALDRGDPPATAFDEARSSSGWHSVTSEA